MTCASPGVLCDLCDGQKPSARKESHTASGPRCRLMRSCTSCQSRVGLCVAPACSLHTPVAGWSWFRRRRTQRPDVVGERGRRIEFSIPCLFRGWPSHRQPMPCTTAILSLFSARSLCACLDDPCASRAFSAALSRCAQWLQPLIVLTRWRLRWRLHVDHRRRGIASEPASTAVSARPCPRCSSRLLSLRSCFLLAPTRLTRPRNVVP